MTTNSQQYNHEEPLPLAGKDRDKRSPQGVRIKKVKFLGLQNAAETSISKDLRCISQSLHLRYRRNSDVEGNTYIETLVYSSISAIQQQATPIPSPKRHDIASCLSPTSRMQLLRLPGSLGILRLRVQSCVSLRTQAYRSDSCAMLRLMR